MTTNIINKNILLQIILLIVAIFSFSFNLQKYPLVDYDEATYAKVTMDTMKSGDILSLKYNNNPWYEKPPLYFWMAITSVKIFGEKEFAFRIPSILFAVLSLWMVFLISLKTTRKPPVASISFLILLSSNIFYLYMREMRLDSGVVFAILLALYFVLMGWENKKYLFGVFPAIAIGIMIKNVIAVLAFPIILIYSFFYQEWNWIKSKYLWWGLTLSSLVVLPWHLLQTWRFGFAFWGNYLWYHVYQRAITNITGLTDPFAYIKSLLSHNNPWTWVTIIILLLFLALKNNKSIDFKIDRKIWAPLFSFIFLVVLFSIFKTRLLPYILPAFPFLALFIGESLSLLTSYFKISEKWLVIFITPFVIFGGYFCFNSLDEDFDMVAFEERDMGTILKQTNIHKDPFYLLEVPYVETLKYYSDADLKLTSPNGETLKAPFYLAIPTFDVSLFLNENGTPHKDIADTKILYKNNYYYLIYSDHDITLPIVHKN